MMAEPPFSFSAAHHAQLFGWISRAIIGMAGEEQGTALIRRAVRSYGRERGRRMALRAIAEGEEVAQRVAREARRNFSQLSSS